MNMAARNDIFINMLVYKSKIHTCTFAVESQRDYHRTRATQAPAPQRSTTTLSQAPTQTEPIISFETVIPGTDVLSTTMGILVHTNSKNTQQIPHVEKTPSTSTTTTHSSSRSTVKTRHHPHKTHRPETIKPSDVTESDLGDIVGHYDTTTERHRMTELAITEEVTTITTTTGRTEPTTTTQPPSNNNNSQFFFYMSWLSK